MKSKYIFLHWGENRPNWFYFNLNFLIDTSVSSPQVIIEGVAGMTIASNIAIDDVTFSMNLTCVSVGKPTPPETFEGNVFLTEWYRLTYSFASRYAPYKT